MRKRLPVFIVSFSYLAGVVHFFTRSRFSRYDFPLDDAWIHAVYARSVAFLHGFQYNTGIQEAGSTSPLWAIVSAPAQWLEAFGTNAVAIGIKGIGVLLGLLLVILVFHIVKKLTDSDAVALIGTLLFSIEPVLLFSVLSGMETILLVVLFLAAFYCILSERHKLAVFFLSLTAVTRPEAAVTLPVFVIMLYISYSRQRPRVISQLAALVMMAVPFAAWMLFCKFVTGYYLPNTFYLKAHEFSFGLSSISNAINAVTLHGYNSLWIFPIGFVLFILYHLFNLKKNIRHKVLSLTFFVVVPAVYLVGVVGTRRVSLDGYYWLRWVDPAGLILSITSGFGISLLVCGKLVPSGNSKLGGIPIVFINRACIVLGVIGLAFSGPGFMKTYTERRDRFMTDSRAIHLLNVRTGQWINLHTKKNAIIGVNDAGAIRFFGNRKTIDLVGLNNKKITFFKISTVDALQSADYLAIFPAWGNPYMNVISTNFTVSKIFSIPVEEYTICDCPQQSVIAILKKK